MVTLKDIQILDTFMNENKIPYVLTGTVALAMHGLVPKNYHPHDIDIIILVPKKNKEEYTRIEKLLLHLQYLAGETLNDYCNVITFVANGTKVNAFMGGSEIEKQELGNKNNYIGTFGEQAQYRVMQIEDKLIRVSLVLDTLKMKFGLKRLKDYAFAKDLVSTILNTGF